MKIKFIAAACLLTGILMSRRSEAQVVSLPHLSIYVHGVYGSALDKSSQNLYKSAFGGIAGLTVGKKNTHIVGSIGYMAIGSELPTGYPLSYGDETYIPARLGVRQNLPLLLNFLFVQGDAGVGFVSYKSNTTNDSRFSFDIGAGAHFGAFEAAVMWDSFKEKQPVGWSSWLTIQAGLNIGF